MRDTTVHVAAPTFGGCAWAIFAGRGRAEQQTMHLSIDTVLPADSVEFCPHPDASDIFVCGTYKLQEEQSPLPTTTPSSGPATTGNAGQNQIRTGQCLVFEVVDSEQEIISACVPIELYFHGVP
jgi:hypothetical protein